jgi:peptidoglycan/xylan/chitin deacetylase (PgdA/CDA1 family)
MSEVYVTTSWDDGHALDMRVSALLKKYEIKGTFYISPEDHEFTSQERLTIEQIKEIGKDFEIGAHTMTHPDLTTLDAAKMKDEILSSKKVLEEITGAPVTSFCYPSGRFNKREKDFVRESGFTLGRTVKRFSTKKGTDPFEMQTTLHAYDHWLDFWNIATVANFNPVKFFSYYRHWDRLAKVMFDRMLIKGGVFHLWGHSWEIEKNADWDKLEEVVRYISNREGVNYISNAALV